MNCPSFFISEFGLFDSRVKFPHVTQTKDRPVTEYELEFFPTDYSGKSWINDVEFPMHRGCFLCAKPGQRRHSALHYRCYYFHLSTDAPELDALLDQASAASDEQQRAELYAQAQHIVLDSYAILPLYDQQNHFLYRSAVHGIETTSVSTPWFGTAWIAR